MKVAVAQVAPALLDRAGCLRKVIERVEEAAAAGASLVVFGETIVPAYPVWLSRTGGARFDDPLQKRLHARYLDQAVVIGTDGGHLREVCAAAAAHRIAVILGVAEHARDRGHTITCSRVFISGEPPRAGQILSVHRKLMPTYEERLAWACGDGAGLVTHPVGPFTVGALNCWENWMPLARYALYAAGEDVHVMLWPGSERLTRLITPFVALESRSYVISASGLIREPDLPADLPERARVAAPGEVLYDGGSCVAAPDGSWVVEPVCGREELLVVELDPACVREERQNFDPAGHYARPDVLRLLVDRRRQSPAEWTDSS